MIEPMKWLLPVMLASTLAAADAPAPRLAYTKVFPGSSPAYVAITLERTGAGEYHDSPTDENPPIKFQMNESDTGEIFSLVEKLDSLKHPLESPAKVAFMGTKTFRFENGGEKHEVKFNYSEDPSARLLADWFERISESEQNLINLERAAKYDKLGVYKAILNLEYSMDRKRLVARDQFLPLLDRIAKNETYMHTARARAAGVAEAIRGGR